MTEATVADGLEARRAWVELRQAMRCQHRDAWDAQFLGLLGERVKQTSTPSMSVFVSTPHGRATISLPVADPVNPRIDTVYLSDRMVGVVNGIPAARPTAPQTPPGFEPIAHIKIPAGTTSIIAANIEGARP
jgi:hypothetical protein